MRIEKKIISALASHERAMQVVAFLSSGIRREIALCPVSVKVRQFDSSADLASLSDDKGRTKTHLWHALNTMVDGHPPCEVAVADSLEEAGCHHCIAAWDLIQQRQQARKHLGVQRRLIRHYGKKACALFPSGDAHLQIDMAEVWHAKPGSVSGGAAVE